MISRLSESIFKKYAKNFPAVIVTGARQVGKTTLIKQCFGQSYKYVLLEDPDIRAQALDDPRTFLKRYQAPVIFDEFQYVPQLTSYLQGLIDEHRDQAGQYILTGSQNFLMMEQVSQSLAGRAGVMSLYGLTAQEIGKKLPPLETEEGIARLILRGTFPELWQKPEMDATPWFGSYLRTYIERDVRNLTQVGDIQAFERFVRLLAIRTGQLLNLSGLARDCGISQPTAGRWLSILVETYQVHLVQPFYENLSSRIKKSPKVYFLDPGMACYLMGFKNEQQIISSPQLGALFETLVITNFVKKMASLGNVPEHYYIETKAGLEVDLMVRNKLKWDIFEIKYNRTVTPDGIKQLKQAQEMLGDKVNKSVLVIPTEKSFDLKNVTVCPWQKINS